MEGKRFIEQIRLRNILSFGERIIESNPQSPQKLFRLSHEKGEGVELQSLNIIIGQNASGKSNLIDVIELLRSLPQDKGLINFISRNGGISEWIWKGKRTKNIIEIEAIIFWITERYKYKISLFDSTQRISIQDEEIQNLRTKEKIKRTDEIDRETSILTANYPYNESSLDGAILQRIMLHPKIFSDLQTNRKAEIRKPQIPDAPNDFLEEDGSNLALVLNDLEHRGNAKDKIVESLKKFNSRVKDYSVKIQGGTVQLYIREEALEKPISAMRLSDGTLRYLCLLAILCHPEPPPLICIEEPEIGLHPDIMPTIAELLKEASKRTQLIVTTHSDVLISAFSDMPEAVLVCEKDDNGTHFKRLKAQKLKDWLDEYSLGDLWLKGEIGGTRW